MGECAFSTHRQMHSPPQGLTRRRCGRLPNYSGTCYSYYWYY